MKKLVIDNLDMMSEDEEVRLRDALNELDIEYKIIRYEVEE